MNPIIVYQSETGNTLRIAETMAPVIQADLASAAQFAGQILEKTKEGVP